MYRTSHSVHHYTVPPPTPSAAGQGSRGKSKGAVNSLKSAASGLASAKRELNSSLREATTLTKLPGSDLLLQVTHTGQYGSSTQPANFAKVKQIAVGPAAR